MSEMVERVARAIAVNHGVDPDQEGPGTRHAVEEGGVTRILTAHMGPLWKMWIPDARAAIEAMFSAKPGAVEGSRDTVHLSHPVLAEDYKAAQEEINRRKRDEFLNHGFRDGWHVTAEDARDLSRQFADWIATQHEPEPDALETLRALVHQIAISEYRDELGHPLKNNVAYRDAVALLKLTGETE